MIDSLMPFLWGFADWLLCMLELEDPEEGAPTPLCADADVVTEERFKLTGSDRPEVVTVVVTGVADTVVDKTGVDSVDGVAGVQVMAGVDDTGVDSVTGVAGVQVMAGVDEIGVDSVVGVAWCLVFYQRLH